MQNLRTDDIHTFVTFAEGERDLWHTVRALKIRPDVIRARIDSLEQAIGAPVIDREQAGDGAAGIHRAPLTQAGQALFMESRELFLRWPAVLAKVARAAADNTLAFRA